MIYPDEDPFIANILVEELRTIGSEEFREEKGVSEYMDFEKWLLVDEKSGVNGKKLWKYEFRPNMSHIAVYWLEAGSYRISGQIELKGVKTPLTKLRLQFNEWERDKLGFGTW